MKLFKRDKIQFIGDLVQFNETQLMQIPNTGKSMVKEIKLSLWERGLSLGTKLEGFPPESLQPKIERSWERV